MFAAAFVQGERGEAASVDISLQVKYTGAVQDCFFDGPLHLIAGSLLGCINSAPSYQGILTNARNLRPNPAPVFGNALLFDFTYVQSQMPGIGGGGNTSSYCPEGYTSGGISCVPNGSTNPLKNAGRPSSCSSAIANPVNSGTGNKFQFETDYVGFGPFPLVFQRVYNSSTLPFSGASTGHLGWKWKSTYDRSVNLVDSNPAVQTATVYREDGNALYFTNIGGAWTPDSDHVGKLVRLTDAGGNPTGWKYSSANDAQETYSVNGRLTALTDRTGLVQSIAYDANGRLFTVTDPFGRSLTYGYDSFGRLLTITISSGGTITYGYSAVIANNLTSVTYPDSTIRTYHYEDTTFANALTGITDENGGRYSTYTYDPQGRIVTSQHANGVDNHSFTYNANGSTTVIDSLSSSRTFGFSTSLGVVRNSAITGPPCPAHGPASTTYDANGFVASTTDWNGNVTTYVNDSRGRETSRTEAVGSAVARTITTEWHPTFRLPTIITEPGRTTTMGHDALGNMLTRTITDTASGVSRTWTYTYNGNGQVLTANGPRTDANDVTTYTYYPNNDPDPAKRGNLASITAALPGHVTNVTPTTRMVSRSRSSMQTVCKRHSPTTRDRV